MELAKRLKELGVTQESLFSWSKGIGKAMLFIDEPQQLGLTYQGTFDTADVKQFYSAFTIAELGTMIPQTFALPVHNTTDGKWMFGSTMEDLHIDIDTEADARAKMLIYLIENGLLKAASRS